MDTKTEFKPPSLCCILHILQTCHLQYKADRATVSKVEARTVFPTPAFGFYLDCFVLGSLITRHSFRSPYLLKYSCRPSETDDKNGPLRNREPNHNRLFQTWLISAHFVGVGKQTPRPIFSRKRTLNDCNNIRTYTRINKISNLPLFPNSGLRRTSSCWRGEERTTWEIYAYKKICYQLSHTIISC